MPDDVLRKLSVSAHPRNHASFFDDVDARAKVFAARLADRRTDVIGALTDYETHEVANDELNRSLDLLQNLEENRKYFVRHVRRVVAFLPLNQPLYSLCCFGVIPALMAEDAFVRAPTAMGSFFEGLVKQIELDEFVPNLTVSLQSREEFVRTHAGSQRDGTNGKARPLTDVVIFTGTMQNADVVRKRFSKRTLFIANGSGHNPIVVGKNADLERAVHGCLRVRLYNQGQDCAAPNTILVHADLHDKFVRLLKEHLRRVRCGSYKDPLVRIGPLTRRTDLAHVQQPMMKETVWLDPEFEGIIRMRSGLVEPALIIKPLREGANYREYFAPVLYLQRFSDDRELATYFEHPSYKYNAMYVTLFGDNEYVERLCEGLHGLHDATTIIRNADLHAPTVERGVKPYGGFGRGASCLSIHGAVVCKPTLPQRDIYEHVVNASPLLDTKVSHAGRPHKAERRAELQTSGSERIKSVAPPPVRTRSSVNTAYIAQMSERQKAQVRKLRGLLVQFYKRHEPLRNLLHEAVISAGTDSATQEEAERRFFVTLYELLLAQGHGPRLTSLLVGSEPEKILELLDV